MYRYEDVRQVHLEITARCNAACPQCPRNLNGGPANPNVPITELSLADIQKIFPVSFVRTLRTMYMCGNYGDPMVAKDTIEVFEYFRQHNADMRLALHTNASGRDPAWWRRLAGVVKECTFSVDGLEDTNHLYRRGTDWKRIRRAMDAYIGAGGRAVWAFIVFRHNEHQVEEARALAREWGFKKFIAKRTQRFVADGRPVERYPVHDRRGRVEYHIETPSNVEYLNKEIIGLERLVRKHGDYQTYLAETDIDCKAARAMRIFVSAEGLVLPCCWMAKLYRTGYPNGTGELWDMLARLPGGKSALDAKVRPLRDIIEGPFFQDMMPRAWEPGTPGKERLHTCARVCGKSDAYAAQFADAD